MWGCKTENQKSISAPQRMKYTTSHRDPKHLVHVVQDLRSKEKGWFCKWPISPECQWTHSSEMSSWLLDVSRKIPQMGFCLNWPVVVRELSKHWRGSCGMGHQTAYNLPADTCIESGFRGITMQSHGVKTVPEWPNGSTSLYQSTQPSSKVQPQSHTLWIRRSQALHEIFWFVPEILGRAADK